MSVPRRVQVDWEDSVLHDGGWMTIEAATAPHDIMLCTSVGYVLRNDKTVVVLGASLHLSNVAGVTLIPKSAVRKITTI